MRAGKTANTVLVPAEELHARISAMLVDAGAATIDADIQAGMLVEGELRGHPSHGARRLPVLLKRLAAGLIVSGKPAVHEWRTEALLTVDGRRGFGPVVGYAAVDTLVERVATTGIAMASIRNSGHLGMLAPYVERIAEAGCIGLAFTVSEALVHPWGGSGAHVGTNPIGIGVPTSGAPLVLDMSTAATSAGKVLDYAARGEAIPAGWAVDAAGTPTTDAASAMRGAISPFGGPKGYALGIALEAIVGLLAGSAFGRDVHGTLDVEHQANKGDLFIAISLEAARAGGMRAALGSYLDQVRASGTDVEVPGDRSRRVRDERLREGIPLDEAVWQTIFAEGHRA